jgi:hypothetical protein
MTRDMYGLKEVTGPACMLPADSSADGCCMTWKACAQYTHEDDAFRSCAHCVCLVYDSLMKPRALSDRLGLNVEEEDDDEACWLADGERTRGADPEGTSGKEEEDADVFGIEPAAASAAAPWPPLALALPPT